jgi:hypothetical protein
VAWIIHEPYKNLTNGFQTRRPVLNTSSDCADLLNFDVGKQVEDYYARVVSGKPQ